MGEQLGRVKQAKTVEPATVATAATAGRPDVPILVVEDDRISGRALTEILKSCGYQVSWAKTVAEAVGALDPELRFILLDLMLPDGNGRQVAEQARARGLAAKLVIISGAGESVVEQVLDLQPQLVLRKPLDAPGLLRWLEHLSA